MTSRQIVALSQQGLSAADIASGLEIEEAAVRLVLNTNNTGTSEDRDINDDQLATIRRSLYNLAVGADDESVQAKVGMFLLERAKPSRQKDNSNGSPIININKAIINAQAKFDALAKKYSNNGGTE